MVPCYEVAPLAGSHGFGAVVQVSDPARFEAKVDASTLRGIWQAHRGLLVVRGYVCAESRKRQAAAAGQRTLLSMFPRRPE